MEHIIGKLRAVGHIVEFAPHPNPDAVQARFQRADAVEFYTTYNPTQLITSSPFGTLDIYPLDNLDHMQVGYATHGLTGEPVPEWPQGMLVIADADADPFILDPTRDGEIQFARHGQGTWDFFPIAPDITGLLILAWAWNQAETDLGDDFDEDFEPTAKALTHFTDLAIGAGIDRQYVETTLNLR